MSLKYLLWTALSMLALMRSLARFLEGEYAWGLGLLSACIVAQYYAIVELRKNIARGAEEKKPQ